MAYKTKPENGNPKHAGPRVSLKAREMLENPNKGKDEREKEALKMLKAHILFYGGKLEVKTNPNGNKIVEGMAKVDAGPETVSRPIKVGLNGKLETVDLTKKEGLDERIVDAVLGYGMGALEVSYRIDKEGNAQYVLRTNGSFACREKNLMNVAMALAGSAQIVKEMVDAKKEKPKQEEPAEVVELELERMAA